MKRLEEVQERLDKAILRRQQTGRVHMSAILVFEYFKKYYPTGDSVTALRKVVSTAKHDHLKALVTEDDLKAQVKAHTT